MQLRGCWDNIVDQVKDAVNEMFNYVKCGLRMALILYSILLLLILVM